MLKVRRPYYPGMVAGVRIRVGTLLAALSVTCVIQTVLPTESAAQGTQNLRLLGEDVTVSYPSGWSVAPYADVYQLLNVPADQQGTLDVDSLDRIARIIVTAERGRDHAEAVGRLSAIATEVSSPSTFLSVGGWPALQRRRFAPKPQPGQNVSPEGSATELVLRTTTAVAAGTLILRLEGFLPSDANQTLIDQVEAIGRGLLFATSGDPTQTSRDIDQLRTPAPGGSSSLLTPSGGALQTFSGLASGASPTPGAELSAAAIDELPGLTQRVITGNPASEGEVAVSTNGQNIVVTAQSAFRTSNDGGQTFPFNGNFSFANRGDSSVAFGRSGAFYLGGINNTAGCGGSPIRGCATGIDRSTNNGQTFTFRNNAVVCPTTGNPGACFPDQEHIAADRFNAANVFNAAAGTGDLLYSVWRNFPGPVAMLVCSSDGGLTWPTTRTLPAAGGDFPRITVGQDGFVYVVYISGNTIVLNKFNPCSAGLVQQGVTATVPVGGTYSQVVCPVPGLDRCNTGNDLASPTVAVDDTNPNHIYVAYGTNTSANNENILVFDSLDGGVTFPAARFARVNNAVPGRRFMPWVCSTGGEAFVSWYDRRAATPCAAPPCPGTNNDLTDYFASRASLDAGGNLVAGSEFRVNPAGSTDPQCASGWPCQVRNQNDSQSCSIQPQTGGRCCTATPCVAGDSQQACDFDAGPACPNAGETCRADPQAGCPKYGDYNGNACIVGRLFNIWASATPPPGTAVTGTIDTYFSANLVSGSQIQVPGNVALADTCVGSTNTATLNVCNTGVDNLQVNSIGSNNTQFAVTTPSSGYPVVISPDFCFPFQVRFTPTSTGAKASTLTIASNDLANPSVTVQATGNGTQQQIATLIANSGNFGDVCVSSFADLNLTISNSGGCTLSVSNITSSNPSQFEVAGTVSFPLNIAAGGFINVPIRFHPTSFGSKTANITVSSNDPTSPSRVIAVSGNAPSGKIAVTGSTDFGDVCAGPLAEKTIKVCNIGTACTLNVTSMAFEPACSDFTLVNSPFPALVSHDSCLDVAIRFTPTSVGPKSCTLVIRSDDPTTPVVTRTVTANTPAELIDVPPSQSFLPEVTQSAGVCTTLKPFPISNTGTCNLNITNVAIGGTNAGDFGLSGLPSFPIILQPGHIAGEGNLKTVFAPTALDRDRLGTLSVTFESDPITHATTVVTRDLCGEGVNTGARVLVRQNGVPLATVEKIQLQRINANRNKNQLDTNDVVQNAALQTVTPTAPCTPFQFHREYGTVGNPIQLLAGSYQVTASAILSDGKRHNKTVGFNVDTCDFNPTVIVDF